MQEGFIDAFKKMNMINRIGKEFDIDNLGNNKITRLRQEPQTFIPNVYNQHNQSINQAISLDSQNEQKFQAQRNLFRTEFQQMKSFSQNVREAFSVNKEFCFGQSKYTAPKANNTRRMGSNNEMSSQATIRNYINGKQTLQFDFQQLKKMGYDQVIEQDKTQNSNEEQIPFILDLREINVMDEMVEVEKTFSYHFKNDTFESILKKKGVFQMGLVPDSVKSSQDALVDVQYTRDMGRKGRHPDLVNVLLVNEQRQFSPQETRFCDILNIASGRLVQQNIANCLKSSISVKRQLQNLRAVLFKMNTKTKKVSDFQQQFGDTYDDKKIVVESSVQNSNSNTQRIVDQLTEMRYKASKLGHFKGDDFQRHFIGLMTKLLAKVMGDTLLPNHEALVQNLHKYVSLVEGKTFSGFDKKKLLWFYAECIRYLKVTGKDENICYLIQKSCKNDGIKTTVIQQNPENHNRPYVQLHKSRVPGVVKSSWTPAKNTSVHKHPSSTLKPTRN